MNAFKNLTLIRFLSRVHTINSIKNFYGANAANACIIKVKVLALAYLWREPIL